VVTNAWLVCVCVHAGHSLEELQWPANPLRTTLLRGLGKLGLARYAQKYDAVQVGLAGSFLIKSGCCAAATWCAEAAGYGELPRTTGSVAQKGLGSWRLLSVAFAKRHTLPPPPSCPV
jgi:hypothetical protein